MKKKPCRELSNGEEIGSAAGNFARKVEDCDGFFAPKDAAETPTEAPTADNSGLDIAHKRSGRLFGAHMTGDGLAKCYDTLRRTTLCTTEKPPSDLHCAPGDKDGSLGLKITYLLLRCAPASEQAGWKGWRQRRSREFSTRADPEGCARLNRERQSF
jgi:hypothetical protein